MAKVLAERRHVGSCQHCASTPTGQKGKWLKAEGATSAAI